MRYYLSCIIFFVCSALFAQDPVKSLVDKLADSYLENGNGALVIGASGAVGVAGTVGVALTVRSAFLGVMVVV